MSQNLRVAFGVCVAASLIFIAGALHFWGAAEIRANIIEVVFLTFAGAVWLFLAVRVFAWLGLSFHDDVIERGNQAALAALCAAVVAAALIYTGGSAGEGPSYLDNVFSAGLGMTTFLLLWIFFEFAGRISMSIAEERDLGSGVRFGALLMAIGLIIGRAIAGDWHSVDATLSDFGRDGWPAIVLWAVAVVIERFVRPSRQSPFPAWTISGLLPALFYLGSAVAWLVHLGAWEGKPK